MKNQETLAKTVKDLMFAEPFYGIFLLSLNKRWDESIPTAGVGLNNVNYDLRINPEFWKRCQVHFQN